MAGDDPLDAVRRSAELVPSAGLSASEVRSSLSGGLAQGTRVGRYELLALIGRGGFGDVYRAYDPVLFRAVALKLIGGADGVVPRGTPARLLEEAQILARLSHPNVVAAYDIGVHEGLVYIVMELIEGVPLSAWLRHARSRAERLQVLIAAGHGLAAAHAAGVVHCDFKPANVMVSRDAQVRVVDFGLARGNAAVQTADQFSYAVTVFEALAGALPYPDGFAASPLAPERAKPPTWPASIPRKLRRVVGRGLAPRAEDRYPSVAALVADLERAASPSRRRIVLGAMGAVCAGLLVFGVVSRNGAAEARCNVDEAAFRGVWDPGRRAAVERAFSATGRSNAGEVFTLVSGRLDTFETEWLAMRQASCEATHVRGEQSERVMAQRFGCLHRQREALNALVAALTEVDGALLDGVAGAQPPSLAACAEVNPNEPDTRPTDPALRAKAEEVELGIAVTKTLLTAGRGPQAIERAESTLELALTTAHARTIAAAKTQLGRARLSSARAVEEKAAGERLLREALQSAAAAGDNALAARTSSHLFVQIGYQQRRILEAEAMLPTVEAVVALAGDQPEQRTELLMGKAAILNDHMQLAEAIAMLDEVIRLAPEVDSEVRQYSMNASTRQAIIYTELGNHEAAITAQQRAVDGLRAVYGSSHPRMLVGLVNLARVLSRAKQREAALTTMAELRRLAATMPPTEPRLENLPQIEGEVWKNLGDCGRAEPFLREGLARFTAAYGANHPRTTTVLNHLGNCLAEQGETAEAVASLERALQSRRSGGETPSNIAFEAFDLAKVLWLLPSERGRARSLVNEAKALWKQDGASAAQIEERLANHEAAR